MIREEAFMTDHTTTSRTARAQNIGSTLTSRKGLAPRSRGTGRRCIAVSPYNGSLDLHPRIDLIHHHERELPEKQRYSPDEWH
ncbi:hypothetical protein ACFHW2_28465 [Actinomadura sp. LOL_016]|uniref:hypothetical protein n=1 Tax=unclassified Actinomadura TaxID=2626254 RepID=UPI003A8059FB